MHRLSDEQLVSGYADSNDSRYVTELYRRYQPRLNEFGRRIFHTADVEDEVQNTFTRVLTKADTYKPQPGKTVAKWLLCIFRNCCISSYRHNRRCKPATFTSLLDVAVEDATSPEPPEVLSIVEKLPDYQRRVVLDYYQGGTPQQFAHEHHLTIDHVYKVRQRAFRHCRSLLSHAGMLLCCYAEVAQLAELLICNQ